MCGKSGKLPFVVLAKSQPTFFTQLRASIWVFVAIAGVVAGLTLVFLGMRSVMDVGGSCASGGPYVSARPCPTGIPLAMLGGIFGGGFFFLIYLIQTIRYGVPGFASLAWSALFLSLGFNFLQYGLDSPQGGFDWGFLFSAAMFGALGLGPLIIFAGLWKAGIMPFFKPSPVSEAIQSPVWGQAARQTTSALNMLSNFRSAARRPIPGTSPAGANDVPNEAPQSPGYADRGSVAGFGRASDLPPELDSFRTPSSGADAPPSRPQPRPRVPAVGRATIGASATAEIQHLADLLHNIGTVHIPGNLAASHAQHTAANQSPPSPGIVQALERLADLHRSGALSDDEFQQAKHQLLTRDQ